MQYRASICPIDRCGKGVNVTKNKLHSFTMDHKISLRLTSSMTTINNPRMRWSLQSGASI